jgi:hypothetical protein
MLGVLKVISGPAAANGMREKKTEREERFEQVVLAKVMSPVIVTVAPEAA